MGDQTDANGHGTTSEIDTRGPGRSWFWKVRKLFGFAAPIIVVALVFMIVQMFGTVPEDDQNATFDVVLVYATALLSPMGITALAGFLCAYSTRGNPGLVTGTVSLFVNLIFTVVLILPALVMLPFFMRTAPIMIPELVAWLGAGLSG